ncbi:MarR family winged helix-turn-helix transcriptional regulator [Arthrobacter sp. GMC3]|uniref:MarR family winged helix-turn-helix transcriptional regulator n=1 Tax=Arthrobacter sp. GMC3 TaxID=2058894 RepID=UPI000CE32792|nr:MarR family transcriptional regulator [Arthrobacter sp. GMC3]
MRAEAEAADFVDVAREGWARTRPELDVSSIEVMGRISRIAALVTQRVEHALAPEGLTRAEFDVLCTLARAGRALRASEVTAATMLSGASTTKNADRLVKRGLIERLPWEHDGRVVLLTLTVAGVELVDALFPNFLIRDREMLAGLNAGEQAELAALLRKIAVRLETPQ